MIRFFCTICNKTKRFRKWPKKIENRELLDPSKRLGKCDSHNSLSRHNHNQLVNPQAFEFKKPVKVVIDTPKRKRAS